MRLLCSLGWHRPSDKVIENEGRTFSRCKGCGIDLVKASHGWKPAPRGYRVIWKKAPTLAPVSAPAPEEAAAAGGKPKTPRRRKQPERRSAAAKELPSHLGGRDRRKSGDRRKGFGKKPDEPQD